MNRRWKEPMRWYSQSEIQAAGREPVGGKLLDKLLDQTGVPSPRQLFGMLDEHGYRGQDTARRSVCLMAYRHIRRLERIHVGGVPPEKLPPKQNILLMGPTGCGKTHLVELLFKDLLGLPCVVLDATIFTENGYVGAQVSSIMKLLLEACDYSVELAQAGIVCLDEFDKLAGGRSNAVFAGAQTTKDVSGYGVQRELLKMLESIDVSVDMGSDPFLKKPKTINTRDVAFVASGAFTGLSRLVERRNNADRIGFGRSYHVYDPDAIAVGLEQQQVNDLGALQTFGFLPELIARFTSLVPFEALDRTTLAEILRSNDLPRYQAEFAQEGIDLMVDDSFMDLIVDQAMKRQSGARGLSSVFMAAVEEAAFGAFGCQNDAPERLWISAENGHVVTCPDSVRIKGERHV